jgi:hypothetical protein
MINDPFGELHAGLGFDVAFDQQIAAIQVEFEIWPDLESFPR